MRPHIRIEVESTVSGLWAWRAICFSDHGESWITAQGEDQDIRAAFDSALRRGLVQ